MTAPAAHRVEKFTPAGSFVLMIGKDVNETTGGNVCTAISGNTCKAGSSGTSPGEFETPTFLAVDPQNGDLYVGDTGDNTVSKFTETGTLVAGWGVGGQLTGFAPLYGIAVDSSGNFFVLSEEVFWYESGGTPHSHFGYPRGTSPADLAVDSEDHLYKADGGPVITKFTDTGANLGEPDGREDAVGLTVDPSSDELFVVQSREGGFVNRFAPNCGSLTEHCSPLQSFGAGGLSSPQGIAVDGTSGDVFVANTGAPGVARFVGTVIPGVVTQTTTEVHPASATLKGEVSAAGLELSECFFEYGETTSYGQKASCEPAASAIPVDHSFHPVQAKISFPGGTVHYRLVAVAKNGAANEGGDRSVSTPMVEADTVHELTTEGKVLVSGTYEPAGSDLHYHFEFVTEQQFKESEWADAVSTPTVDGGSGTGRGLLQVEAPELSLETGYLFRAVGESAAFPGEPVYSPVKSIPKPHPFEPAPESCPNEVDRYGAGARLPDCRAYEQVTPAEKGGAQELFGSSTPGLAFSNDGENFRIKESLTKWGTNVGGRLQNYDFKRTSTGWQMHSFAPQPESKQITSEVSRMNDEGFSNFMFEKEWDTGVVRSEYKEYVLGPAGGPYKTVARERNLESNNNNGWHGQSRDGKLGVIVSTDHELIPGHPTHTVGSNVFYNTDLYAYSARTGLVQVNVETGGEPIGTNGTCGAFMASGREEGPRGGDHAIIPAGGFGSGTEPTINTISEDGSRIFFYDSPGECARQNENTPHDALLAGSRTDLYMREPYAEKTYDLGHWTFEGANPQGTRLFLGKATTEGYEYVDYNTETRTATRALLLPEPITVGTFRPYRRDVRRRQRLLLHHHQSTQPRS